MPLPAPRPGLVIRYSYLWRDEADRGREEGTKDRPCVIVLTVETEDGGMTVRVAPITHTPPDNPADAVEIPSATKRRLNLDDARSWISARETNVFVWPGPDIRPIRGKGGASSYGMIAGDTFRILRDRIIANIERRRARTTERSE